MRKMSAKDIAFEKEGAKYRKEIRALEHDISFLRVAVMQKDNELHLLRNELEQKSDWIRRLLEYTELSEDDMRTIIDKEKNKAAVMKMFGELSGVISGIYRM